MNEYKLQRLDKQREEIRQLLSLFDRAAFRAYDKGYGGDPTAVLNAIWDTRIALSTRGASLLQYEEAAGFFRGLQERLWELEKKLQDKYPEVVALASDWRGKPINTPDRIESIKNALGNEYVDAADFIRAEAFSVYDSPKESVELLRKLDAEIEAAIKADFPDITIKEVIMGNKYSFGNITGSIVNVDSVLEQVTQNIGSANNIDETAKKQLTELIEQLKTQLQQVPSAKKEEVEAIADTAKALVEASTKAQPNKTTIQITADGLKKAAENLSGVMPTVLGIVKTVFQIVGISLP
ncbi:MAG TPA: hypothetical protein DCG34_02075 [Clostridiales bacterium]|jgi:hypothetical protein|nr:hypothetical protein [Clostridiales bacterium]